MPCHESNFVDPRTTLESKFNDIKVIGGSCSGCVLSAIEKNDKQQRYALKRLALKRRSHCRVALRELRILKRLRHENIVKTSSIRTPNGCDASELDPETFQNLDYVYLAEELADTDLHNILNRTGKIEEKFAKLFLYQLLRGLKYIHSANVVHRDIKPGNLFVNVEDLSLKVGDFGLARIVDPKFSHGGHLTELVATRYYRSPEVMLTPGKYDSSVDIWSCGCVFAEMCTGNVLFPGENDFQQIDCIQTWFHDGGRLMTSKLSGISQAGLDILQKMLRMDPSKRFSASQLLEDPYFGDISDAVDEPACPQSDIFHIEHEVDDLSVQTLKHLILKECCPDKYGAHDINSELFEGFDEDFSFDDGDKFETEQSNSFNDSSEENSCPSLLNIMSSSIVDEPYRDPACSEARSQEEFFKHDSEISECTTSGHCSPNFPKVTSFLEIGRSPITPAIDSRRPIETNINFQAIPRSFLCSTGLDKELISKFTDHALAPQRSCRLSELAVSEHLKNDRFNGQFNHWDTIRIWI